VEAICKLNEYSGTCGIRTGSMQTFVVCGRNVKRHGHHCVMRTPVLCGQPSMTTVFSMFRCIARQRAVVSHGKFKWLTEHFNRGVCMAPYRCIQLCSFLWLCNPFHLIFNWMSQHSWGFLQVNFDCLKWAWHSPCELRQLAVLANESFHFPDFFTLKSTISLLVLLYHLPDN
jgi:hypothetical protein